MSGETKLRRLLPSEVADQIRAKILDGSFGSRPLREVFGYQKGWELPSADDRAALRTALGASGDSGEPGVYVDP